MRPAVRIEHISKHYHVHAGGARRAKYGMLRETLTGAASAAWRRIKNPLQRYEREDFWALDDVSFEVNPGEVVGIVGRNGAGKSTLLKILSKITSPTKGRIEYVGRVGSLLEVGTGFHMELTGRENVFLNGAILGMTRKEIVRKFDEIVDFSGVDKFLDTPVKHYSSGMKVRLAFSVAAHLEPEIVLVDEVLAVGDQEFQNKCMAKMDDIGRQGRTVFFVSHNMGALRALCRRGVVLEGGRVYMDMDIDPAIDEYLKLLEHTGAVDLAHRESRRGAGQVRLTSVEIADGRGGPPGCLCVGKPARFTMCVDKPLSGLHCGLRVYSQDGQIITRFDSRNAGADDEQSESFGSQLVCELDELCLMPGRYRLDVTILAGGRVQDGLDAAAYFDVLSGDMRGRPVKSRSRSGHVMLPHRWRIP